MCFIVGRIYDVSVTGEYAVSTTALCCTSSVDTEAKLLSPSRHLMALGDTAVSFDFGEPIDLGQDVPVSHSRCLWPVYILLGNGEVYRLITSVDKHTLVSHYYILNLCWSWNLFLNCICPVIVYFNDNRVVIFQFSADIVGS